MLVRIQPEASHRQWTLNPVSSERVAVGWFSGWCVYLQYLAHLMASMTSHALIAVPREGGDGSSPSTDWQQFRCTATLGGSIPPTAVFHERRSMERRKVTKGCSWSFSETLLPACDQIRFLTEYRGGNVGFRVLQDSEHYVLRGSCWFSMQPFLKNKFWAANSPQCKREHDGFRVVRDE